MKNNNQKYHIPVMPKEVLEYLNVNNGSVFVDGTLGAGGHTKAMLSCVKYKTNSKKLQIIGIDRDQEAIEEAEKNLNQYENIAYIKDNFVNIDKILRDLKIEKVDGILLDLGVSSHQLDDKSRGFSFSEDKENLEMPLDMRMDKYQRLTAREVVNKYSKTRLANIIFEYGEERNSRKIASAIVSYRRKNNIRTVGELVEVVRSVTQSKQIYGRRKHFATNVFRALRIEVNRELEAIKDVIPKAINALKPGGRLVVITFHSLEDRIVKHDFRNLSRLENPKIKLITKKPIVATFEEIKMNKRARSAKLRVLEKI